MNLNQHGLNSAGRKVISKIWTGPVPPKRSTKLYNIDHDHLENFISQDGLMFTSNCYPSAGIYTSNGMHIQLRITATNNIANQQTSQTLAANVISTSPDGHVWTARSVPFAGNYVSLVEYNKTVYLFSGNGSTSRTLMSVNDGVTWTQASIGQINATLKPIVFKSLIVAASGSTNTTPLYAYNPATGVQTVLPSFPVGFNVAAMATDGNRLVVVGRTGGAAGYIFSTTDLTSWTLSSFSLGDIDLPNTGYNNASLYRPLEIVFDGKYFVMAYMLNVATGTANLAYAPKVSFARSEDGLSFKHVSTFSSQNAPYGESEINQTILSYGPDPISLDFTYNDAFKSQQMVTSNGRIILGVTTGLQSIIDASTGYRLYSVALLYSSDSGESWDMSEMYNTQQANTNVAFYCIYACPNGAIGYLGTQSGSVISRAFYTNPSAKQVRAL